MGVDRTGREHGRCTLYDCTEFEEDDDLDCAYCGDPPTIHVLILDVNSKKHMVRYQTYSNCLRFYFWEQKRFQHIVSVKQDFFFSEQTRIPVSFHWFSGCYICTLYARPFISDFHHSHFDWWPDDTCSIRTNTRKESTDLHQIRHTPPRQIQRPDLGPVQFHSRFWDHSPQLYLRSVFFASQPRDVFST